MRKNIFSIILTILIIGGAMLLSNKMANQKKSLVSEETPKKERRSVTVQNFTSANQNNIISIDGRLQAHDRVSISSKVQGVLKETGTSLRKGRYVKKGQILFEVDNREADFNVKAQRSNLFSSITQMMPDLKYDYPDSFNNWDNYLKAFDIEQHISALPEPFNEQEKFFVASRNIYNQYYTIKALETQLAEFTVYSPFSGIITEINAFPGALINPNQVLATMINTATYELVSPIELNNIKFIKSGQKVTLRSNEMDQTWTGKVSRIGSVIDQATQNIPVYISVSGKGLKDGMYLKGNINGSSYDDVFKVPKSAFTSPDRIFVVEDSTLVSKVIDPVKRLEKYILVKGINPDDQVVVSTLSGLFEGQKVNY